MENSGKKWWQKIDVVDIVIASAVVPLVERVVKHFGKKAEDLLGLDFESAKSDVVDDFYFLAAQSKLSPDEVVKIYNFKHWLRDESGKAGPDEESAFILYIAKMVKTFEREREKKDTSEGEKKSKEKKQTYSEKNLEKGVFMATNFFKNLLSRGGHPEMRHFLENENVFTLIPKEKEESPIITKAKKMATNTLTKMGENGKASGESLGKKLDSLKDWSEKWRDAAPRRK
jgi:hypothetical protein